MPMSNLGVLVGRILISPVFIISGIYKFVNPGLMLVLMKSNGMPAPQPLLYTSAIIEVVCGLMLLIGVRVRYASVILFLWLVPVTLMMHIIPGGQDNRVEVLKNLAIMGGLLILSEAGPAMPVIATNDQIGTPATTK